MTNTTETVQRYFDMWNESNSSARRTIIEHLWVEDARSVDPVALVNGWAEIDAMVAKFQEAYPEHRFALAATIDEHHDRVRFGWEMRSPDGSLKLQGIDCVKLSRDGRIEDLSGFFDEVAR